jgi:hypothetical protein
MSGPSGHAHDHNGIGPVTSAAALAAPAGPQFSPEKIKELVAALEVPFDPFQIEWRVMNTTKDRQPARGQVVPYADQRAYTDRLNALFTPAGWTRRYCVHTSANFERGKDQKIVAKVLVTCELTIFSLGTHAATGEEWADNDNAGTSAEAQAFKRAGSCFGLGRYLYYFEGVWADLDERKRPKSIPQLPSWATPTGWAQGLRPIGSGKSNGATTGATACAAAATQSSLTAEIESKAEQLGRGLYRGLLRDLARVWSPREIQDVLLQQRVLEHMRSAERGLKRLEAALDKVGPEALVPVLKANQLTSIERVDNLETLKRIVVGLERASESHF